MGSFVNPKFTVPLSARVSQEGPYKVVQSNPTISNPFTSNYPIYRTIIVHYNVTGRIYSKKYGYIEQKRQPQPIYRTSAAQDCPRSWLSRAAAGRAAYASSPSLKSHLAQALALSLALTATPWK